MTKRTFATQFFKQLSAIFSLALTIVFIACTGLDGKDGIAGVDGKDGVNGVDGKDGTPGADGKDAVVNTDSLAESIKKELINTLKDSLNVKSNNDSGNIPQSVTRSLYAENIEALSKTDVYGAFANQYSLLYADFNFLEKICINRTQKSSATY